MFTEMLIPQVMLSLVHILSFFLREEESERERERERKLR